MRAILLFGVFLGASLGLWSGCMGSKPDTDVDPPAAAPARVARFHVESGTPIRVTLRKMISARTARPGDAWDGWMAEEAVVFRVATRGPGAVAKPGPGPGFDPVVVLDKVVIPAGSHVSGVVTAAPANPIQAWAMPALAVKAIDLRGRVLSVSASARQLLARPPRPAPPGAPAGGADGPVLGFTIDEIVDLQ
jgi:hypothetical protein